MYWLITTDGTLNGTPLESVPEDLPQPPNSILVEEDSPYLDVFKLVGMRTQKIKEIKEEGLRRIQLLIPGVKDIDTLELVEEIWLSIAPTARQATANFQAAIDIRVAAKAAIITVNGITTLIEMSAYDPTTDPGWPA